MTPEEYFLKYRLSLEQAVTRLHEDRRDILATRKDDPYFPQPYRLHQESFRNMSRGATHAWLEHAYVSFAEATDLTPQPEIK